MSGRTYQDAIEKLNTLQSNAAALEVLRASGGRSSEFAIPEMIEYLGRIGYKPEDLNQLNVMHITGTKGKGSTSAFADSILRKVAPGWKVGLYTSPHLVAVRERIRLNGVPISEEDFAKYFFEVWDRLESNDVRANPATSPMPMYFRYLTLMAFHYFASVKVDATILEVGVGGTYDSTNIVPKPVVTGITSLGLDHTAVLGRTLGEIAWQKGGICKEGVPAFSSDQLEEGLSMLKQRARECKASSFTVIPPMAELSGIELGLSGTHQVQNASLAIHMTHQFLLQKPPPRAEEELPPSIYPTPLSEAVIAGVKGTRWPGRCQTVHDPKRADVTWFLDGAHTTESLKYTAEWFFAPEVGFPEAGKGISQSKHTRILIFNCTHGRSGGKFLKTILEGYRLQSALYPASDDQPVHLSEGFFDHVIFCTNVTYSDGNFKGDLTVIALDHDDISRLGTQNQFAQEWSNLVPSFPKSNIHVLPSIEHAVSQIEKIQGGTTRVNVLVAGSLHLVGGVIEVAGLADVALTSG
ncbi:Folylpolyglutamate synthetase [Tulasnella sp. 419]|nr:Folylpolyglutamate synthetase [Tulasnella sp. 419]